MGLALRGQEQAAPGSKGGGGGVSGTGLHTLPASCLLTGTGGSCSCGSGRSLIVRSQQRGSWGLSSPTSKGSYFYPPPENALRQKIHTVRRS